MLNRCLTYEMGEDVWQKEGDVWRGNCHVIWIGRSFNWVGALSLIALAVYKVQSSNVFYHVMDQFRAKGNIICMQLEHIMGALLAFACLASELLWLSL